jgi:hypothetical protein
LKFIVLFILFLTSFLKMEKVAAQISIQKEDDLFPANAANLYSGKTLPSDEILAKNASQFEIDSPSNKFLGGYQSVSIYSIVGKYHEAENKYRIFYCFKASEVNSMAKTTKEINKCSSIFVFMLDTNRWIMEREGWSVVTK